MPCVTLNIPKPKNIDIVDHGIKPNGQAYIVVKSSYSGKARITLDGKHMLYIDVKSGTQTIDLNLPPGKHTICIYPA